MNESPREKRKALLMPLLEGISDDFVHDISVVRYPVPGMDNISHDIVVVTLADECQFACIGTLREGEDSKAMAALAKRVIDKWKAAHVGA